MGKNGVLLGSVVAGVPALLIAMSSACYIASVSGPQFDVVLGPISQESQTAFAWIVGTVAGAVAVFCAVRVWRAFQAGDVNRRHF